MRVVLDTNVLISALLFGGTSRALLDTVARGEVTMLTSPAMLDELTGILSSKFGWPDPVVDATRETISSLAVTVYPEEAPRVSRDPDDDVVLATAIAGEAAFIVTGDKDLLVLGVHEGVAIETPADFERRRHGG